MADQRLRELERLAATGGPADRAAWQRERLRLGLVRVGERRRVVLAADLLQAVALDGERTLASGIWYDALGEMSLRVHDAAGVELRRIGPELATQVAVSPDRRRVLATHSHEGPSTYEYSGVLACFDIASGREEWAISLDGIAASSAFSPDGSRVVAGCTDRVVRVLDAFTGAEVSRWSTGSRPEETVAWAGGERVVTAGNEELVRLWDAATGREVAAFAGHEERVNAVAASPDGALLVSGAADRTVRVWDVAAGREVACLVAHKKAVGCVAVCSSFRRVLSGSDDGAIVLWDLPTRRAVVTFDGHADAKDMPHVACIAFSLDGLEALSAGADGTIRTWDLPH